jgi:hypothetical protein
MADYQALWKIGKAYVNLQVRRGLRVRAFSCDFVDRLLVRKINRSTKSHEKARTRSILKFELVLLYGRGPAQS